MKIPNAFRVPAFMLAALLALALPEIPNAPAQTVTQQPQFIAPNTIKDLGNGPIELRTVLGNAWAFTSSGSGVGSTSGSATLLTLTATPTTVPLVGGIISGAGITSGTTVSAYSGVSVTLSAAMTVAASTPVAWGAACPAFSGGLPAPNLPLQAGTAPTDLPLYTQARICGYSANGPGATVLPFAIGAH
jgi:hypothetical protein